MFKHLIMSIINSTKYSFLIQQICLYILLKVYLKFAQNRQKKYGKKVFKSAKIKKTLILGGITETKKKNSKNLKIIKSKKNPKLEKIA